MSPELTLALQQSACRRAHLAGADALIFEREAAALLKRAAAARQLYYRELITVDLLGGQGPSAFEGLIR